MALKRFENNPNHEYILTEEGNLQSREVAEKYIYNKNRDKYSQPFGFYVVHHIDGDTFNNSIKNLYICSRREHQWIHSEQISNRKKFKNSREIDFFLIYSKAKGSAKLPEATEYLENLNISQVSPEIKKQNLKEWEEKKKRLGIKPITKENIRKKEEPIQKEPERIPEDYEGQYKEQLKEATRRKRSKKKIVYVILAIVILSLIFLFINFKDKETEDSNIKPINTPPAIIIPEVKPLIVEGSRDSVIITNNQDKDISVNVTYRIFSNWFGIDTTENKVFEVGAKQKQTFKVYNNDGCNTAPCSLNILDSFEV